MRNSEDSVNIIIIPPQDKTLVRPLSFVPLDLLQYVEKEIPYRPYKFPVFGASIAQLVQSEEPHYFFKIILNYLSSPLAISAVGIFRVSGKKLAIAHYKQLFDDGKPVNFKCSSFDVAGLLKEFLTSLPDPIIPPFWNSQIPQLLDNKQTDKNYTQFLDDLKLVVTTLPKPNYIIFRLLIIILSQIACNSGENMMTVDNITKCLAPDLYCYPALVYYSLSNVKFFFGDPIPLNTDISSKRASTLFRSVSSPNIVSTGSSEEE